MSESTVFTTQQKITAGVAALAFAGAVGFGIVYERRNGDNVPVNRSQTTKYIFGEADFSAMLMCGDNPPFYEELINSPSPYWDIVDILSGGAGYEARTGSNDQRMLSDMLFSDLSGDFSGPRASEYYLRLGNKSEFRDDNIPVHGTTPYIVDSSGRKSVIFGVPLISHYLKRDVAERIDYNAVRSTLLNFNILVPDSSLRVVMLNIRFNSGADEVETLGPFLSYVDGDMAEFALIFGEGDEYWDYMTDQFDKREIPVVPNIAYFNRNIEDIAAFEFLVQDCNGMSLVTTIGTDFSW